VTSIHDGGGVLHFHHSTAGYINPRLDDYLDQLGYAPEYLVFHPPHVEGVQDAGWWERISGEIVRALDPYRTVVNDLTLENMPTFEGYTVPLITPDGLHAFVRQHGLGVTVDTTHYAQIGMDLLEAARVLQGCIRSVHLSDYTSSRTHVFVGEGELDLAGFLSLVDSKVLNAVTLECSVSTVDRSDRQMSHAEMVNRLRLLKAKVENLPIGESCA
jgi:sugar phosphate isomerase/epimerase